MRIEDELRQYVTESLLEQGAAEVADDTPLIANGLVDSLGLIKLLSFIQQRWQVDLQASGGPDDFQSVASLAAAIRRHGQA